MMTTAEAIALRQRVFAGRQTAPEPQPEPTRTARKIEPKRRGLGAWRKASSVSPAPCVAKAPPPEPTAPAPAAPIAEAERADPLALPTALLATSPCAHDAPEAMLTRRGEPLVAVALWDERQPFSFPVSIPVTALALTRNEDDAGPAAQQDQCEADEPAEIQALIAYDPGRRDVTVWEPTLEPTEELAPEPTPEPADAIIDLVPLEPETEAEEAVEAAATPAPKPKTGAVWKTALRVVAVLIGLAMLAPIGAVGGLGLTVLGALL